MVDSSKLRVAIVHDWILVRRGAEKCLESFCEIFPNADIYTLMYKKGISQIVDGRRVYTSFLQRFPFFSKYYRYLLPLMPIAAERFILSGYDIVISSNYCVAKGVITSPETLHVSYIHTPMRYGWDMYEDYFGGNSSFGFIKKLAISPQISNLRLWDQSSSSRPDLLIANSKFVRQRIAKYWRKESVIINPPVDVTKFKIEQRKKDYFLMVSSFEPNRRVDIAVRAFTELGFPLKIVGSTGRLYSKIKKMAGMNVEFLGQVTDEEIVKLFAEAKALIVPGKDDFGIAPLEAIASGTPVIAYASGGALDTIIPVNPETEDCIKYGAKNGFFIYEQDPSTLKKIVREFLEYDINHGWDRIGMRKWAKRFTTSEFKSKIKKLVIESWEYYCKGNFK